MSPQHDQVRREQVRAVHRRDGKVCSACGQTWPCTSIAWADNIVLSAATLRWRKIRAVLVIVGIVASPVVVTLLSMWLAKG